MTSGFSRPTTLRGVMAWAVVGALCLTAVPASGYKLHTDYWGDPELFPQGNLGDPLTIEWAYQGYNTGDAALLDPGLNTNLTDAQLMDVMEEAMFRWSQAAPLHFVQKVTVSTSSSIDTARIAIGHHAIDGSGSTLAHATYPDNNFFGTSLTYYHLDNADSFGLNGVSGLPGYDLLMVSLHELGHNLGLEHHTDAPSVMKSSLQQTLYNGLGTGYIFQDDIDGIRAAYGTGVGSVTSHWVKGDANRDGQVDTDDLTILATNWQQAQFGFSGGNFDYDGLVDNIDLALLVNNWNHGVSAPEQVSIGAAMAAIGFAPTNAPEPGSAAVMVLLTSALMMRRRRLT